MSTRMNRMKTTLNRRVRMAGKFISQTSVICMCQKQLIGISNTPINIARIVTLDFLVEFGSI